MGAAFVEPAIVPDIFISGVAEPEQLGDGLLRYTSFARQKSFHSGEVEFVIVNRVIVPIPAVILSMRETLSVLKLTCFCRAAHARLLIH
jgi:hypothetical protein